MLRESFVSFKKSFSPSWIASKIIFPIRKKVLAITRNKLYSIRLMKFQYTDGGRSLAGYSGKTGDCVVRALTLATGSSYMNMYQFVNATSKAFESHRRVKSNNVHGVYESSVRGIMRVMKFKWTAKRVGAMLKVPTKGSYIVSIQGHVCAVVNGIILDTHNSLTPDNLRYSYGYWKVK